MPSGETSHDLDDSSNMELGLSLIPFGVVKDTGLIASVDDVANGRKCGCICPCCQTPLIARQGQEKVWHFAHESRGTYKDAADACELSLWVSLKLMARQLFQNATAISLPSWNLSAQVMHKVLVEPVAEARRITFGHVEIESRIGEVAVDAAITISSSKGVQFRLGILLRYPTHEISSYAIESEVKDSLVGFIEIDLEEVWNRFPNDKQNYLDTFARLLIDDTAGKRWLLHPNLKRARQSLKAAAEKARKEQELAAAKQATASRALAKHPAFRKPLLPDYRYEKPGQAWRYGCVDCCIRWTCLPATRIYCPDCHYCERVTSLGPGSIEEMGHSPSRWRPS